MMDESHCRYQRMHKGKTRVCFTFQVMCSELAPAARVAAVVAILTQIFPLLAAVEANHISGMVRKGVKLRTPLCLSKAAVCPHLEGSMRFWSLHFQEIIKGLGKVWRRAMASGSVMSPCPSMHPRAAEQLEQGGVRAPFLWPPCCAWHRAWHCSSPCSRQSETSCEESLKGLFLSGDEVLQQHPVNLLQTSLRENPWQLP